MVPSSGRRRAFLVAVSLVATRSPPCRAAESVQNNLTSVSGYTLLPGVASVPAPVRVAPDQDWLGVDGYWNTFSLLVGEPAATVHVQVSTASQQIWSVNAQACTKNMTDSSGKITALNQVSPECVETRGRLYNQTASQSWHQKGYYRLWLEKWLGLEGNGLFGWDSVGLGQTGEEGPRLNSTVIGTLVSANFWMGHIGLHPKPTNFSAFEDPVPSFMTGLFEQKSIPSLSFGYTAGARYIIDGNIVPASLTLGGYDASRTIPNELTFIMAPDNERDLVVGVAGLTASTTNNNNINLLEREDLNMFIDSTVAEMWLPIDVCKAFEDAFGLKYDNKTNLYLVDDVLHQNLLAQNPSITFTLGQKYTTNATMQITLPYAAMDLEASPPYRGLQQKSRYFPLRQGGNSSQWVLGRTFLQEAYLTVDWERHNFSVSAVDWSYGKVQDLTAIVSPQYVVQNPTTGSKPLSTAAIIGAALGGSFLFALSLIAVGWWLWRRHHLQKLETMKAQYEAEVAAAAAAKKDAAETPEEPPLSPMMESDTGTGIIPKAELSAEPVVHHELGASGNEKDALAINEVDNTERQIFEMEGCIPEPKEAGGRQLSEKESMVVRERIYNGVDSHNPAVSPLAQEASRRLAPVSPSEVTMLNGRLPSNTNVSPVSPRTPRDGAFLEKTDTFFQLPPYCPRDGRVAEESLFHPISPLEGSTDTSRRRFSYES
ncbi:aspartic peptidase domain-containing protein [Ampelomyces quisqualis]|uniref:Aspartic peptidase domain-containing protein n=1 Tax=Ampelomyces quisqualis TaxID=50730 RepID=A0A6A5QPS9_AMPQU|nr:aspartic peptidase domain-containing protein [Ampelomyces quisqualis]